MASPTRFNDRRYSKWGNLETRQTSWVEELQRQADNRPKSRYEIGETVLTPQGMKAITDKYHRASGWQYTFWTKVGLYSFSEKQLMPLGDALLLQDIMSNKRGNG